MEAVIVGLLIALIGEISLIATIPVIVRRRNNKNGTSDFVTGEGGGKVCVYHKDVKETVDRIEAGVGQCVTAIAELKAAKGEGN